MARAFFAATGLALPIPIERCVSFLSNTAGPTALFALGCTLGRTKIGRNLPAVASGISLAKLVAYPALVWLMLEQVMNGTASPWSRKCCWRP